MYTIPYKKVGMKGYVFPSIFKTGKKDPEIILIKGGYTKTTKGWIKKIDDTYRFHAYIRTDNNIEIHTDKIKKIGRKLRHIASTFMVKEEKKFLKGFKDPVIQGIPKKQRKFKNEILPQKEMQEAIRRLDHR